MRVFVCLGQLKIFAGRRLQRNNDIGNAIVLAYQPLGIDLFGFRARQTNGAVGVLSHFRDDHGLRFGALKDNSTHNNAIACLERIAASNRGCLAFAPYKGTFGLIVIFIDLFFGATRQNQGHCEKSTCPRHNLHT